MAEAWDEWGQPIWRSLLEVVAPRDGDFPSNYAPLTTTAIVVGHLDPPMSETRS